MTYNFAVTGPGFTQYVTARSYSAAIEQVAQMHRVHPAMLCVRLVA